MENVLTESESPAAEILYSGRLARVEESVKSDLAFQQEILGTISRQFEVSRKIIRGNGIRIEVLEELLKEKAQRIADLEGLMELDRRQVHRLEERLTLLEAPLGETDIQLRLQCQKLLTYGTTGMVVLAMLMSVYTSDD